MTLRRISLAVMRSALITMVAASLACPGAALAANDAELNARLSGNTVVVTQRNFRGGLISIARIYLSPGGAYASEDTIGQTQKGTWRTTETDLCLTAVDPLPPPQFRKENCLTIAAADQWRVTSPQAYPLQYDIVKGRLTKPLKPVLPNFRYPELPSVGAHGEPTP